MIAEGVESETQLSVLADFDCDSVQGFLFSRPVPPEECERFFKAGDRKREPAVSSAPRG